VERVGLRRTLPPTYPSTPCQTHTPTHCARQPLGTVLWLLCQAGGLCAHGVPDLTMHPSTLEEMQVAQDGSVCRDRVTNDKA
jgi:hypothetical protein